MHALALSLIEHAKIIDLQNDFQSFTGKTLAQWIEPLANSITDKGYIPYLIETKKRYRASPLSSTISWLDSEGLLPVDVLSKMQEALLFLRGNNAGDDPDQGNTTKFAEDNEGWSLGEGVSVWSTSMAIIAMLDQRGVGLAKAQDVKSSVLWLTKQQSISEKGWAYQLSNNCSANTVMTALALYALSLSIHPKNKNAFTFLDDEYRQIITAIRSGFEYLESSCIHSKGMYYWCFNNIPHCAATTWALCALSQMAQIDDTCASSFSELYVTVLEGGLQFVLSKIPSKGQMWESEQLVYEGGAKYNKQKNYFSYSPTLLPQLFMLGLSPFHPKVISQITWLVANPTEWKITGYDKTTICTFTYAMVLSVLASWSKRVGCVFSATVNTALMSKRSVSAEKVFGYRLMCRSPVLFIQKNRILLFSLIFLVAIVISTFGHNINDFIQACANNLVSIWDKTSSDRHDILINVIASVIYAVPVGIIGCVWKIIKNRRSHKQ